MLRQNYLGSSNLDGRCDFRNVMRSNIQGISAERSAPPRAAAKMIKKWARAGFVFTEFIGDHNKKRKKRKDMAKLINTKMVGRKGMPAKVVIGVIS